MPNMIFVNRSMPARTPAGSEPTSFLVGSLSGPVMISPRELVLTAPVKKRRAMGDSGSDGVSTCGTKLAEERLFTGPAASLLRMAHVPVSAMPPDANKSAASLSRRDEAGLSFMRVSQELAPGGLCLVRSGPSIRTYDYFLGRRLR